MFLQVIAKNCSLINYLNITIFFKAEYIGGHTICWGLQAYWDITLNSNFAIVKTKNSLQLRGAAPPTLKLACFVLLSQNYQHIFEK